MMSSRTSSKAANCLLLIANPGYTLYKRYMKSIFSPDRYDDCWYGHMCGWVCPWG